MLPEKQGDDTVKIILIECAKGNVRADRRCDSEGFSLAYENALTADIVPISMTRHDASEYKIYTSTSRAAIETAEALFSFGRSPERTPLLDDVPLVPFTETKKQYPLWLWYAMGRLQWRMGSRRQPEARADVKRRAGDMIDLIERDGADCVLIARGLYLRILRDTLCRRGYCIQGGGFQVKPLDRIRATKQTLHCGGCIHNCMLSNPGCGIGMLKAKEHGMT